MRAIVLKQYGEEGELAVGPAGLPLLQPSQVLVRMEYATVSVPDLSFLQGKNPVVRTLPAVPGFEGSGTVVESGSKLKSWRFQGKRVAVFGLDSSLPGTWAEYAVVPSKNCFLLRDSITFEQGAGLFVRPLTVCMCEEMIAKAGTKAIIQTGGASAVAKALLRICNYKSFACVCVIQTPEEAEELSGLGAKYILLADDPDFSEKVASMCEELAVKCGFDCVGGRTAGDVLNALMPGGALYVYEDSLKPQEIVNVSPISLIFKKKKVVGLNLLPWFERKNSVQKVMLLNKIQTFYVGYRVDVLSEFVMEDILSAISLARESGRKGKILLRLHSIPSSRPSTLAAEVKSEEEEKVVVSESIPVLPSDGGEASILPQSVPNKSAIAVDAVGSSPEASEEVVIEETVEIVEEVIETRDIA